jgi:hypothetical protein
MKHFVSKLFNAQDFKTTMFQIVLELTFSFPFFFSRFDLICGHALGRQK